MYVVANWNKPESIITGDSWRNELFKGMRLNSESTKWLILEENMSEVLQKPSFIFARKKYADHLIKKYNLHVIKQKGHVVLLSN